MTSRFAIVRWNLFEGSNILVVFSKNQRQWVACYKDALLRRQIKRGTALLVGHNTLPAPERPSTWQRRLKIRPDKTRPSPGRARFGPRQDRKGPSVGMRSGGPRSRSRSRRCSRSTKMGKSSNFWPRLHWLWLCSWGHSFNSLKRVGSNPKNIMRELK